MANGRRTCLCIGQFVPAHLSLSLSLCQRTDVHSFFRLSSTLNWWTRKRPFFFSLCDLELDVFDLAVVRTSYGQRWDTLPNQRFLPYWDERSPPTDRRRKTYTGKDSWANFRGRWGDDGEKDCWWWKLYPGCQVSRSSTLPSVLTFV